MKKHQSGFAAVELVVSLVIIAAVVGVGYYVWHEHNTSPTVATVSTSSAYHSPSTAAPVAPTITKASDLNSAMQALNQTNVTLSNTDSSQLSTQSNGL